MESEGCRTNNDDLPDGLELGRTTGILPAINGPGTCGSVGSLASTEVSWGFFEGEVSQGWQKDSVTVIVDEGISETIEGNGETEFHFKTNDETLDVLKAVSLARYELGSYTIEITAEDEGKALDKDWGWVTVVDNPWPVPDVKLYLIKHVWVTVEGVHGNPRAITLTGGGL
ncbi:MAG: hypothetical protein KAU14_02170 [Thermoplasmata archaeon]|nr:hypothetical protein [Thermoplasmata archaeon]